MAHAFDAASRFTAYSVPHLKRHIFLLPASIISFSLLSFGYWLVPMMIMMLGGYLSGALEMRARGAATDPTSDASAGFDGC